MIEILRDSVWQFVGAVLALIALITTFVVYYFQKNKKSLVYQILYDTELFTKSEELAKDFKIFYKDQPIKNASLVFLELINNGNQPIATADFEKPLNFVFDEKSRILSAEIIAAYPENLEIALGINENILSLSPLLLNSKDRASIKLLLDGNDTEMEIDTRIIGVSKVGRIYENRSIPFIFIYLFLFFIIAWFGVLANAITNSVSGGIYRLLLIIALLIAALVVLVYAKNSLTNNEKTFDSGLSKFIHKDKNK